MRKIVRGAVLFSLILIMGAGCPSAKKEKAGQPEAGKPEAGKPEAQLEGGLNYKRYNIKSAIIKYQQTGVPQGTEEVYFDRYGAREARYAKGEFNISGFSTKINTMTLNDGEWIYSIDLDKRSGTKISNVILKQVVENYKGKNLAEIGEEFLKATGGVKTGVDQVAGRTCDVWEIKNLNAKSCIWKGITLKSEVKLGRVQQTTIVTSLEENVSIPADKFVIPSDIKFSDSQGIQDYVR